MENVFLSLSVFPSCVEGVEIHKVDKTMTIDEEFGLPNMENAANKIPLAAFLEEHEWREYHVSLIIPMEKVTCRILKFPFQDPKQIKQIIPFEIENEVIGDVADIHHTYKIYPLLDGTANVLVMMVNQSYLEALKMLFMEWEIYIKNVDCAAYVLYNAAQINAKQSVFQIYLGADETFINFVQNQKLQGVKYFPNRIPDLLSDYWHIFDLELSEFLRRFGTHVDKEQNPKDPKAKKAHRIFKEIKSEIRWLCAQFNLFLRTHHLYGDCQVFLYGVLGAVIEWTGYEFQIRNFPLSELQDSLPPPEEEEEDTESTKTEASTQSDTAVLSEHAPPDAEEHPSTISSEEETPQIIADSETTEVSSSEAQPESPPPPLASEETQAEETSVEDSPPIAAISPESIPPTVEEEAALTNTVLLDEREASDSATQHESEAVPAPPLEKTPSPQSPIPRSNQHMALVSAGKPHTIPLALDGRRLWGILGDLCQYQLSSLEGSDLSFYSEGAPLTRFLRKNRRTVILCAIFVTILIGSMATNYGIKLKVVKEEVHLADLQLRHSLQRLLPDSEEKNTAKLLGMLKDKIEKLEKDIEVSKKFNKREYRYVTFLKDLSEVLGDKVKFRVDRLELSEDRFSISGLIESYDNLQLLKNGLSQLERFKNSQIVESNRKSPEGIIYRISVEL